MPSAERFTFPCCLWLFTWGKNACAVCSWRKGFSNTIFWEVLCWVRRIQQAKKNAFMTGMHAFHGNYYAFHWGNWLLKEGLVQTDWGGGGGGRCFVQICQITIWPSMVAECGPSLKGLVHFTSRRDSPGNYSISGNCCWFPLCLPSSFLRKPLNGMFFFFKA